MKDYKKIHFIGIGGIGISALAYLAIAQGKKITGSDSAGSAITDDLSRDGAVIEIGHRADNVTDDTELIVYTEAIDRETNPEYLRAKELGIPALSYFEALGQVSRAQKTIAVVGTHGKTTVTAMLGLALIKAEFDPMVIVGSKLREFGGRNIRIGGGDVFVAEGCEYRRSFLNLDPFGVVFLNCEAEHLDYYKNEQDYKNAYKELIAKIPSDGFIVANMDDKNVKELSSGCAGRVVEVSKSDADALGFNLKVLGDFNRLNAAQAYRAAEALGADLDETRKALEEFAGTWRRMEFTGKLNGAQLIDDYGHHPTEVFETLRAVKNKYPDKRLICVFQPHQYSRTRLLIEKFKGAFRYADKVIITDIYAARDTDEDMAEIDGEKLTGILSEAHSDVEYGDGLDNTYSLLKKIAREDDVIITMGAGSIGNLANRLAS